MAVRIIWSCLEPAEIFPSLHAKLIIYLEEALQPLLPEPYFAQTGERTWIEVARTSRGRHFGICELPDPNRSPSGSPSSRPREGSCGRTLFENDLSPNAYSYKSRRLCQVMLESRRREGATGVRVKTRRRLVASRRFGKLTILSLISASSSLTDLTAPHLHSPRSVQRS